MFSVLHLIWILPRWRGDNLDADENWIEQGIDTRVRRFKKETLINHNEPNNKQ
jgi:hypothetical protein